MGPVSGEFLDWSTLSAWDVTFALLSVVAGWARPITIGSGRVTARVQVWHEPGRSQSVGAAVVRELAAALSDRGPDVLVTSELPTSMTRTEER